MNCVNLKFGTTLDKHRKKNKIMRTILLLLVAISTWNKSHALELNYTWKVGETQYFSAKVTDDVSTSMMGMTMKDQFTTTTDFGLHIQSVNEKGTAKGILFILNFNVVDSKNTVLASLKDIPNEAIHSDVEVDKKGNFTFLNKVYMITTGNTNVLAYGNADGNSVSTGAQAGNMKVDAYAEFDPKTGKLKTGYTVKEIGNTKPVNIQVKEDSQTIDILPYDFLQFLALPDGHLKQGDHLTVQSGMYKTNFQVKTILPKLAVIEITMNTDKSADLHSAKVQGGSADGTTAIDMDAMDMNSFFGEDMFGEMDLDAAMGGSDMTQEDQAAMNMSKAMAPDMTVNLQASFNPAFGQFEMVAGNVRTKVNTMGLKMEVNSVLEMRRVQ